MGHPPVSRQQAITRIQHRWANAPAWRSIRRTYAAEDVVRLYRDDQRDLSAARQGVEKLCAMISRGSEAPAPRAILARSSAQVLQGLQSGAASLCLVDTAQIAAASVLDSPAPLADRIAHIALALQRADQRQHREGIRPGERRHIDYAPPVLAHADNSTESALDVYQRVRDLLEAGVAGVVLDDHSGHRVGDLAPPTIAADTLVQHLTAARMAADVAAIDTLLIARTCALDEDGACASSRALDQAIARARLWAPFADVIGLRHRHPDLQAAERFARAVRRHFPRKPLCYDGPAVLDRSLREQLSALGYCFVLPSQTADTQQVQLCANPERSKMRSHRTLPC